MKLDIRIVFLLSLALAGLGVTPAWSMTPAELATTRQQAEQGSSSAQLLLGIAYQHGDGGLAVDGTQAIHWLELAALQGNAYAEARLGDLYEAGTLIPQNLKLSADWRQRAAQRGDVDAECKLGRMYLQGAGVERDPRQAREWLKQAAANGNGEAAFLLSHLYRHGIGGTQDQETAEKLLRDAATCAYGEANLFLRSLGGDFGHPDNRPLSRQALEKLAADGDPEASSQLAHERERQAIRQEKH